MPREVAASRACAEAAQPQAVRTAIVVDDHKAICDVVVSQLRRLGLDVRGTTSRDELATALAAGHPDLLLLDLSLGDSDAVEVFGLLGERGFAGRVVLMSGHADAVLDQVRRIGQRAGVEIAAQLRKPFRNDALRHLLAGLGPAAPVTRPHPAPPAEPGLLHEAIARGWLDFAFLPKVDLATDAMAGMEALARIRHPERGTIEPAMFLPAAQDEDLYSLALAASVAALAAGARAPGLPVSINLAGRTLLCPGLIEALKAHAEGREHRLVLEITESDLIADIDASAAFATRAMLHGFTISLDDFGSGYATFERLRHFPFAELKIERSIVHGCAADETLRRLCRAAVELGHGFGAKVVAEGVESGDDLAAVRALGFDLAQGYLFSRPLPADEVIALLAGRAGAR